MPAPAIGEYGRLEFFVVGHGAQACIPLRAATAVETDEEQFARSQDAGLVCNRTERRLVGREFAAVERIGAADLICREETVIAALLAERCERSPGRGGLAGPLQCDGAPVTPFFGGAFGRRHRVDVGQQPLPLQGPEAAARAPAHDLVVLCSRRQAGEPLVGVGQVIARRPQCDMAPGALPLLRRKAVALLDGGPGSRGDIGVPVGQSFGRISQLLAVRRTVVGLAVAAQEDLGVGLCLDPECGLVAMRLVDLLGQPACETEFPRIDREIKTLAIVRRAQQLLVVEKVEYRIALTDLAGADQPQVACPLLDSRMAAAVDFGLQCQAIESRDVLALVETVS